MIDVTQFLTGPQATKFIPGQPHRLTVWRWMMQGKLKSYMIGGRRFTTHAAIQEFIGMAEQAGKPQTAKKSKAQIEKELDEELR